MNVIAITCAALIIRPKECMRFTDRWGERARRVTPIVRLPFGMSSMIYCDYNFFLKIPPRTMVASQNSVDARISVAHFKAKTRVRGHLGIDTKPAFANIPREVASLISRA
jgi:hypothetical protein